MDANNFNPEIDEETEFKLICYLDKVIDKISQSNIINQEETRYLDLSNNITSILSK